MVDISTYLSFMIKNYRKIKRELIKTCSFDFIKKKKRRNQKITNPEISEIIIKRGTICPLFINLLSDNRE